MRKYLPFSFVSIIAFWTFLVSASVAQVPQDPPKPFRGTVVGITDGDTITVLFQDVQHRIRLQGIDAPEGGQPFGTKAKNALANKVFGQSVTIDWKQRDNFKRILGEVYLGNRRIGLEMVEEGYAWHFRKYSRDADLANSENRAIQARRGLWIDKNAVPPWEFRKGTADDLKDDRIYITATGGMYHRDGCRHLAKSKIPIRIEDARVEFLPCLVCNPPK